MTAKRGNGEGSSSAAKKPKRQDSSDEAARDVRLLLVGFVQPGDGTVGSLPATKGDMNVRPARLLPTTRSRHSLPAAVGAWQNWCRGAADLLFGCGFSSSAASEATATSDRDQKQQERTTT